MILVYWLLGKGWGEKKLLLCVCVCWVWCSDCVLGSGPEVLSSNPTLAIFYLVFLPLPPTSPPSCDWVPGIFWGANSRPFFFGTLGAHTTCCEERSVLLRVPSPVPGALLAWLTVPA